MVNNVRFHRYGECVEYSLDLRPAQGLAPDLVVPSWVLRVPLVRVKRVAVVVLAGVVSLLKANPSAEVVVVEAVGRCMLCPQ